jgi:hypothetical protein
MMICHRLAGRIVGSDNRFTVFCQQDANCAGQAVQAVGTDPCPQKNHKNVRVVMTTQEHPSTLDLAEAAHLCKCSTQLLRRFASSGTIPATKVGRKRVFPTRLLQECIEERSRANVGRKPRFGAIGRRSIVQALTAGGGARLPDEHLRELRDGPVADLRNRWWVWIDVLSPGTGDPEEGYVEYAGSVPGFGRWQDVICRRDTLALHQRMHALAWLRVETAPGRAAARSALRTRAVCIGAVNSKCRSRCSALRRTVTRRLAA